MVPRYGSNDCRRGLRDNLPPPLTISLFCAVMAIRQRDDVILPRTIVSVPFQSASTAISLFIRIIIVIFLYLTVGSLSQTALRLQARILIHAGFRMPKRMHILQCGGAKGPIDIVL